MGVEFCHVDIGMAQGGSYLVMFAVEGIAAPRGERMPQLVGRPGPPGKKLPEILAVLRQRAVIAFDGCCALNSR